MVGGFPTSVSLPHVCHNEGVLDKSLIENVHVHRSSAHARWLPIPLLGVAPGEGAVCMLDYPRNLMPPLREDGGEGGGADNLRQGV